MQELKNTASFLDLHLEMDSEGRLRTKLYDKRDDFNFPIVDTPFIDSSILAASVYWVYMCQLIRYSWACGSYQNVLDRGLLLTRRLQNHGLLLTMLKSSLRMFYGRRHDLICHYETSVSQITTCEQISTSRSFLHSWLITGFVSRVTRRVSQLEQKYLPFRSFWVPPGSCCSIFSFMCRSLFVLLSICVVCSSSTLILITTLLSSSYCCIYLTIVKYQRIA